jgi:hypothetical protein
MASACGLVGNSNPWDEVNTALDAMLGDLLTAGATALFVPNLPDIVSIAEFAGNAADSQSAHDITVAGDDGLKNRLIGLHHDYLMADIFYFDVYGLFNPMLNSPSTFGFTDVTSECRSATAFSKSACGNCHDNVDFARHAGGQTDEDYDILTDPVFTGASVSVRNAWTTSDYTNTGNEEDNASSVSASALTGSIPNGDGNFSTTQAAIDAGTVVETCNVCHGAGKVTDVTSVHNIP